MQPTPKIPWSRQGARNVAGVTYQVAVSAYILAQGRAGVLPVTSVLPEGMEDIDCQCRDGTTLIVQTKERGDGSSTIACAAIAETLEHALPALEATENAHFVVVTNAQLGTNLKFTGWQQSIRTAFAPTDLAAMAAALDAAARPKQGILLPRTSLVALERQLGSSTTQILSETYGIAPAVAALVYSQLVQDLGEVAALQRHKTPQSAVCRQLADLDALVERVLSTVDVTSLDLAIRGGVIESLDFTVSSALSQERFLLGVDTTPSHIAANLDLERPIEDAGIATGLLEDGYVVIVGPSGCGKSSLLWRSARNCAWAARKARILRLTEADVPELVRWCRLQQPSLQAPILMCVDNLGRATTSGWTSAVEQLRGMPGVVLLGAARREDFNSSLAATGPRVVEPALDSTLAGSIAATLSTRGITTTVDPDEAFAKSGGLLMEFLFLLLAGRRMRDVVTAQVEERMSPDRATERNTLRYVCSAHRMGLGIHATMLGELLGWPEDLHQALSRLRKEHLLTENENTEWIGLHELRSEMICDVLYRVPPPTEEQTYAALLKALPAFSRVSLLQRYGYLSSASINSLAMVTSEILRDSDTPCDTAVSLTDALRECETVRHAKACVRVAHEMPNQSKVPILDRLTIAVLMRETGFKMPSSVPALEALAQALPERRRSYVAQVFSDLGPERLVSIAKKAPPIVALQWLAAIEGYAELSVNDAKVIWSAQSATELRLRGRILASLSRIAQLSPSQVEDLAGPSPQRMNELIRNQTNGIRASVEQDDEDGLIACGEVMVPEKNVDAHQQAVTLAEDILALLPEANIAEVITREPGGREHLLNGHLARHGSD